MRHVILHIAALCVAAAAPAARAATVTWDGGAGDGRWESAQNWSGNLLPTANDDVILDAAALSETTINGNIEIRSLTLAAGYTRTLVATGNYLIQCGDYSLNGGVFDANFAQVFVSGDFIRTGGSATLGVVLCRAPGIHEFASGPDRLDFRTLLVNQSSGVTVIMAGPFRLLSLNVTATAADPSTVEIASGSTVEFGPLGNGGITLATGGRLLIRGGAIVDARVASDVRNIGGSIVEAGGYLRFPATGIGFVNASGNAVKAVAVGDQVFARVQDRDENTSASRRDTVQVVFTSLATGDQETVTLLETTNNSGLFISETGLPTVAAGGPVVQENGVLAMAPGENLRVLYTDSEDGDDLIFRDLLTPTALWTGAAGDGRFENAANWNIGIIPSLFDDVLFAAGDADCSINGPRDVRNFTVAADYAGTVRIVGNNVDVNIFGDFIQNGGTLDWGTGSRPTFYGDYTYNGGNVSGGRLGFVSPGNQTLRCNLLEMVLYSVYDQGSSSHTLTLEGNFRLLNNLYIWGTNGDTTTRLAGGSMLRVEGFFESHAGTTLVLEPAATFDMSNGGEINNFGRIVELGSARLIRASSGLSFTDADGNIMNAIPAGGGIYIQVQDIDENSDGQALDQVFVTVENLVNGDREIATLTETAPASGLFRSLPPGLPSAQAGVVPGDGIMQRSQTDALRAAYTDEQDPSDAGLAYLLGVAQRVIEYLLGIRNDPTGLDYNSDGKVDIGDAVHRIGN